MDGAALFGVALFVLFLAACVGVGVVWGLAIDRYA